MSLVNEFLKLLKEVNQKVRARKVQQEQTSELYNKNILVRRFFEENGIHFSVINTTKVITAFDFDERKVELFKNEIFEGKHINLDNNPVMTYNKDHVHIIAVELEASRIIVLFVLYPFDALFAPKVLWSYETIKERIK